VCVVNGRCELQNLAVEAGIDHVTLPYLSPARSVDASHERFAFDFNRCVLCTRCVRVCGEVEGAHTWDVMGRGIQSCVITDLKQPWGTSETCTSCGKCVQVCPTGALFEKGNAVGEMNKHSAFLVTLAKMREGSK
jgi:bidirectional [NiFe] hydrogenase diaphorase subunit